MRPNDYKYNEVDWEKKYNKADEEREALTTISEAIGRSRTYLPYIKCKKSAITHQDLCAVCELLGFKLDEVVLTGIAVNGATDEMGIPMSQFELDVLRMLRELKEENETLKSIVTALYEKQIEIENDAPLTLPIPVRETKTELERAEDILSKMFGENTSGVREDDFVRHLKTVGIREEVASKLIKESGKYAKTTMGYGYKKTTWIFRKED